LACFFFRWLEYKWAKYKVRKKRRRSKSEAFSYDAFVSYCKEDSDFVQTHLVKILEEKR